MIRENTLINYFNFKKIHDSYLITNDLGRHHFLSKGDLHKLLCNQIGIDTPLAVELREKYFMFQDKTNTFVEDAGMALRYYKKYLFKSTSLHIFVVTKRCNQTCIYCQASTCNSLNSDMTKEVAKAAVDIAISSPTKNLTFEFQGGEPLLNFETIKFVVEYTEEIKEDKNVEFVIVSNLTILRSEHLQFIKEHKINISTSLDGGIELHTLNRPMVNSKDLAFDKVIGAVSLLQDNNISVSAIQTTSKNSLSKHKEIVNQYIQCEFKSLFLRPLTPLGYAKDNWATIGYSAEEFIEFYRKTLSYIIKKNLQGVRISEGHARIFLSKILDYNSMNFMELRSPCGGGIGQIAYNYDGNIYTCDEARMFAEMGDDSFKMGNVFDNNYNQLMSSNACKAVCMASTLEAHNLCSDCVYSAYCGTCPVVSLALTGSIYSQMSSDYRCKIYMGMLDTIFEYLESNDDRIIEVFKSWVE